MFGEEGFSDDLKVLSISIEVLKRRSILLRATNGDIKEDFEFSRDVWNGLIKWRTDTTVLSI